MKKIIYSLVIMIAAGSLFTSCIEQVEPLGIQDMRFAKAEYIRALKDLRAADAELQRALAAVELANARYRDAETANLNADTEYQKLLNEYQKLINEARQDTNDFIHNATISAIDSLKKEIELRELTHAKAMVDAEKELAQAKEELRVALRNISLAAGDLTGPEKVALAEAVAVYYGLTEEVIKQEYRVFKAQQKVDTLTEYALRFSDTAWNGYALVDMDDYYEDAIAWEEAKIAKWMEDYEAIPDSSARVAEWKAYVDKFADRVNKLDYELAKIDANETAIASLMKEGVRDFNLAIADFIEENWDEDPAGTFTEPTGLTDKEADTLSWGAPKQEEFKQHMDTIITFPDLLKEDFNVASNYEKYVYLLSSYKQESKVSASGKKVIDEVGDTLRILKANQSMKDFILGKAGDGDDAEVWKSEDGKKQMTASYGLKGALDVMKRVYNDESNPLDTATIGPAMRAAETKWTNDHAVLKNGFLNYSKYTSAIADVNTAKSTASPEKLIEAIKNLYKELNADSFNGVEIGQHDSIAVINAIETYAKERDAYLDDYNNVEGAKKYAKGANPHYFYFATKLDEGQPVVDSVAFSEIASQTKFKASAYVYTTSAVKRAMISGRDTSVYRAFANILDQLFPGLNVGEEVNKNPINVKSKWSDIEAQELIVGAKLMTTGNPLAEYKVNSWSNPTTITCSSSSYEPNEFTKAKQKIYEAIAEFNKIYNAYWKPATAADEDKTTVETAVKSVWNAYVADPKNSTLRTALQATFTSYDEELMVKSVTKDADVAKIGKLTAKGDFKVDVFKPFTKEEAPLVTFTGTKIDSTEALCVVLNAVDPKGWERTSAINSSAIFSQNATDFRNMMYYRYQYWLATHAEEFELDTKVINDWISAVEHAFALDAEKAGMPDVEGYEAAKEAYDRVFEKDSVYQIYADAKKAFTGTRVVDGDTVINPVYNVAPSYTKPITPAFLTDVKSLFATNLVGEYVGWIETLGGEQLANAIEAFGEEPWEQFNEWNAEKAQYTAQKTDLSGLKTKAEAVYKAEAKMEGYDRVESAADFEAAYKAYVQAYKALRDAIVVYDEFGNIDMKNTEAKVNKAMQEIERLSHEAACYKSDVPDWEGLIAEAQKDLKVQEARLQTLKSALEYAKTNYEKLKEYILSQDASYVIPVSVADIQSLLKGLGIDINALIGTYLGNEEEVEPVVEP